MSFSLITKPGAKNVQLWKYFGFRSSDGKTVDAATKDAVFCKIQSCPKPEMKYIGNTNTLSNHLQR